MKFNLLAKVIDRGIFSYEPGVSVVIGGDIFIGCAGAVAYFGGAGSDSVLYTPVARGPDHRYDRSLRQLSWQPS